MVMRWIYKPYRAPMRWILTLLLSLAGVQLLACLLPSWPALHNGNSYLALHNLMEIASIVISFMVFAVGWNSNSAKLSGNIFLAIAFLTIGLLDFFHTLSYVGMPDFLSPNDIQKHLYFWLPARLLAAFTLLCVAIGPRQIKLSQLACYLSLACFLFLILGYGSIVVFHQAWFPDMYVLGQGLTSTKRRLEYFISMVNVVTALLLLSKMRSPQPINVVYLFGATCTLAMGEYYFAIYTSMTGSYNILGHIYKMIGYLLIYRAIVSEIIEKPYALLKKSEDALLISKKQHDRLISNIPIGVYLLRTKPNNDRIFEYISAQFCNLLHVSEKEVYGESKAYLKFFTPEDRDEIIQISGEAVLLKQQFIWEGRILVGGKISWLRLESRPEEQANGDYLWDGVVIDITERKNNQSELLSQQANYDQLTKLPNRRLFTDRLEQEIKRCERGNESIALLFIDLDRFKEINDTQGHDAGDLLLIEAAQRIKSCVRAYDTVARFGGDEFTVILAGKQIEQLDVERVAKDINFLLNKPFEIEGITSFISASIGISIYPQDGKNTRDLLKSADQAMYEAKANGKGNAKFFTPGLQLAFESRVGLSKDLRKALKLGQIEVYYQPIVNLVDSSISKAEALLRWNHPELGQITPATFIPIAEDSGTIHEIGGWALDQVIMQIKKIKPHIVDFQISINISPVQFKRHSNDHWIDRLKVDGLLDRSIIMEITEGLLLTDIDNIIERLKHFRRAGIPISIDDFGTGYSSLSYLKDLPLDYLKIDQSFIKSLTMGDQNLALCEAIIMLSQKLGLMVIAEGIETPTQCDLLNRMGCDFGQGYLFYKPMPAFDLEALLNLSCDKKYLSQDILTSKDNLKVAN